MDKFINSILYIPIKKWTKEESTIRSWHEKTITELGFMSNLRYHAMSTHYEEYENNVYSIKKL